MSFNSNINKVYKFDIYTTKSNVNSSNLYSPLSPLSPHSPTTPIIKSSTDNTILQQKYSIKSVLKSQGYECPKQISEALQGSIWETSKDGSKYIIKAIDKSLHRKHITYANNKEIAIEENIIKESAILKYLSNNHPNPPDSFTKFIDIFSDEIYFYLVQEHGGKSLFYFVKKCHRYIEKGLLNNAEWSMFCKAAMRQMVDLIRWMHNDMHCCHLDVSLENFVISDVHIVIDTKTRKIKKIEHDFQIKIIDFGLAEVFTNMNKLGVTDFQCTKFVGKPGYKSPEVHRKKDLFDARSADCWSLGVTFFMMIIGAPPFRKASRNDRCYCAIVNGKMIELLYDWNKLSYVTRDVVDLMQRMLVKEKYRLNITEIQRHSAFL